MKVNFGSEWVEFNVTNKNDHIQKYWSAGNFYETGRNQLLTWCYASLPQWINILDIGANLGNHSVFFSKIMKANKVYSFEPYTPNYRQLISNLKLNGIENVTTYPFAAYNTSTTKSIRQTDKNNSGMVQFSEGGQVVPCERIDNIIHEKIDYIKIDVESAEIEALEGCQGIIDKWQPIVSVETEYPETVDKMLHGYKRLPLKLNHTPTYIWKKQ